MNDGSDALLLLFMHVYLNLKKIAYRSVAVGGLHLNFLGLKRPILKCTFLYLCIYTITQKLNRIDACKSPRWQSKMKNEETCLISLAVSASLRCCTSKDS